MECVGSNIVFASCLNSSSLDWRVSSIHLESIKGHCPPYFLLFVMQFMFVTCLIYELTAYFNADSSPSYGIAQCDTSSDTLGSSLPESERKLALEQCSPCEKQLKTSSV